MAGKTGAPRGLGIAGKALHNEISAQLEADGLTPDSRERAWLDLACREADQLAAIEAALAGEALIVRGSRNQDVAHPLIAEARSSRLAIAGLLARIGLEDPATASKGSRASSGTAASLAARRAALTRHHGRAG